MKAVISLSGGMDSTCLLINLLASGNYDEIKAVSFDYGQKHRVELQLAAKTVKNLQDKGYNVTHHIVDLTSVGILLESALTSDAKIPQGHYEQDNMKATVVPNRNIMFGSIVYAVALSMAEKGNCQVDIALGVHAGDHAIYPDCRPESVAAAEHAFKISNWGSEKVNYIRPYIANDKADILADCWNNTVFLGLDFDKVLINTITSYDPDSEGRSSGKSGSDIERIEAFLKIGRKDPIQYTQSWEETVAHAKTVLLRQ